MFNFKRTKVKKEEEVVSVSAPIEIKPPECSHKWKDFHPFLKESYSHRSNDSVQFCWEIVEPYVCCWCKKRDDQILVKNSGIANNIEDYNRRLENFKKPYLSILQPEGIVINEVQDMIHSIDREYLEIVASCFPEKPGLSKEDIDKIKNKTETF